MAGTSRKPINIQPSTYRVHFPVSPRRVASMKIGNSQNHRRICTTSYFACGIIGAERAWARICGSPCATIPERQVSKARISWQQGRLSALSNLEYLEGSC
jgi:hypothetical protein